MQVTDVKVDPVERIKDSDKASLLAYASVIIDDCICIREMRLVVDLDGKQFVAMPSAPVKSFCGTCGKSNPFTAKFCMNCGAAFAFTRSSRLKSPCHKCGGLAGRVESVGRTDHLYCQGCGELQAKLSFFRDMAFPVNSEARGIIEQAVIGCYAAKT